jgi:hypothetical protein
MKLPRCPKCKAATAFSEREVNDLRDTGMKIVCSACRRSTPAADWLKGEHEPATAE